MENIKVFQVIYGKAYMQAEVIVLANSEEEAIAKAKLSHPRICEENDEDVDAYEVIFDENGCSDSMYIGE
jgi:hypothetical protein